MSKLTTEKLKEQISQWLSDPTVMNKAKNCLGFSSPFEEQNFVSDFANKKNWKRSVKCLADSDGGVDVEDLQDSFDHDRSNFGDVAGEMLARPEGKSIFRCFELSEKCLGSDNFRIEIITDPKDEMIQCWELCVD